MSFQSLQDIDSFSWSVFLSFTRRQAMKDFDDMMEFVIGEIPDSFVDKKLRGECHNTEASSS